MLSGKAKLNLLSRSLQFINSRNFGEGYFYSPFLIWCVLYIINSGDQHEQGVTAHGSNNTVEKLIGYSIYILCWSGDQQQHGRFYWDRTILLKS